MPPRPRGLAETLAELEQNPRLAGVGPLVSRLEGAISLPPRRLAWSEQQDRGLLRHHDQGVAGANPADPVRARG